MAACEVFQSGGNSGMFVEWKSSGFTDFLGCPECDSHEFFSWL